MKHSRVTYAFLMVISVAFAGCVQGFDEAPAGPPDPDATTNETKGNQTEPRVINDLPVPRITLHEDKDPRNTTTRGFKGAVLVLNGTNSTDPDGTITQYLWEIVEPKGEGGAPESKKYTGARVANIVFGDEGVKIVTLTVVDNLGAQASTSVTYYRDAAYSYGDQFHWSTVTEPVKETRTHVLPVIAGAAQLAAHVVVTGAQAEIALFDPQGNEHVRDKTPRDGDNVTIVMDHGAPAVGDWTIEVIITYAPEGVTECQDDLGCQTVPVPVAASHDADYGLDGIVWYGEAPADASVGDGHGHAH